MDYESTTGPPAGLLRRLAALLYDSLLAAALAAVATFALLPLTRGEAIVPSSQGLIGPVYHALVVAVLFGYFGWCWTRTGQTLGLMAWRMELMTDLGGRIGWWSAALRFLLGAGIFVAAGIGLWDLRTAEGTLRTAGAASLVAPLVVNYLLILIDPRKRSLLEIAGRTRVVRAG